MSGDDNSISDEGFVVRSSTPVMGRGLSQVMFNYLPERTFDYDRGACIGKVFELRLSPVKGVDVHRLIASMNKYVSRWEDRVDNLDLSKPHLLLFARPNRVLFNLFPLVFQCTLCGRLKTFEREAAFVKANGIKACVKCGPGARFEQIYHILVHECGQVAGLFPRKCPVCKKLEHIALDLRGSQQARDFRWLCRACGRDAGPVQRACKNCSTDSEGEASERNKMRVIPHRANQAFYAHHVTVLNLPTEVTALLEGHPQRDKVLARAVIEERYGDLPAMVGMEAGTTVVTDDTDKLTELLKMARGEERPELEKVISRLRELQDERARKEADAVASSTAAISEGGWLEALEYVNVHTLHHLDRLGLRREIEARHPGRGVITDSLPASWARLGLADIQLVHDFPVVTAVFGFTRVSFEPETNLGGKTIQTRFQGFQTPMTGAAEQRRLRPIFVDDARTEALFFKLSPRAIALWLKRRGHAVPDTAVESDPTARAWLLAELTSLDTFLTFQGVPPLTRDAFTLTHTMAHLTIRVLSRISGIERTGLAEYLFPRLGSFAIYNTKASSNLGGLNTVFCELQEELLATLQSDIFVRACVYDPVCSSEWHSTCHACTHLSEMSCKHYNRGLSRAVLYGPQASGSDAGFLATL